MDDNKEILTSDNVKSETSNEENTTDNVKSSREISNANLKPIKTLSKEEAKRRGSIGGIKSGEVRKARKTASELLTKILATNMTQEQIDEILGNASSLLGQDTTAYNVMLVKALQVAMSGDTKAIALIRDTIGDAPVNKQETNVYITDSDKALIDTVRQRLLG